MPPKKTVRKRDRTAKVVPTHRTVPPSSVLDKYERFARVYAATMDADQALDEAGYKPTTAASRAESKNRLLRNPVVRNMVDDLLAKAAAKYEMTTEGMVARFKYVYMEAVADRDWTSAVSALREAGK